MSSDPIHRVSVVSTGTVAIHPEHVGPTRKPLYWWLFTSRRWTPPRPINAYVIEHREGLVLFDTGQDRASVTDPNYFPKGFNGLVYDRLARFAIEPHETLGARLNSLGHDIADVHTAVLSHLHQDHIGGLPELAGGNTTIVTSPAEWQEMMRPSPEPRGFLRSHIMLPRLRWQQIQPEAINDLGPFTSGHDLFGDGAIVLLPTPGHTPGSLSMLIRRPGRPPLLMVGDLTYDARLLAAGNIPGAGNRRQMRDTIGMVNALRQRHPDLVVLAAHDPNAANLLAAAQKASLRR